MVGGVVVVVVVVVGKINFPVPGGDKSSHE
jgi:hypothetical protein